MGILTGLLKRAIGLIGFFGSKPKFSQVFMELMSWLPKAMSELYSLGRMNTKEQIDEALQTVDDVTGVDDGAFDMIRDLPSDKEEALFDHLTEIVRILAYNKIKLEGFYVDPSLARPSKPD